MKGFADERTLVTNLNDLKEHWDILCIRSYSIRIVFSAFVEGCFSISRRS